MTRYERTEIGDNGNRWNLPVRAKWNHSHVGSCYYKPSVWLKSDICMLRHFRKEEDSKGFVRTWDMLVCQGEIRKSTFSTMNT